MESLGLSHLFSNDLTPCCQLVSSLLSLSNFHIFIPRRECFVLIGREMWKVGLQSMVTTDCILWNCGYKIGSCLHEAESLRVIAMCCNPSSCLENRNKPPIFLCTYCICQCSAWRIFCQLTSL